MLLMQNHTPISRRSLHDELLVRLRTLVIDGALPPGAKIPEKILCERFGVSRTPLREALKVLAAEGLVELSPNRGASVAQISLNDLEEWFPVMAALEQLSGELSCKSITDEEIAQIRRHHEAMREEHRRRNLNAYFALNRKIHDGILAGARNAVLSTHYHQISQQIRRARLAANLSYEQWDRSMAEHEDIIQRLEARDGEGLGQTLREHILHLLDHYRVVLGPKT